MFKNYLHAFRYAFAIALMILLFFINTGNYFMVVFSLTFYSFAFLVHYFIYLLIVGKK